MSKHNNKWVHGVTNLVMPPPPSGFMQQHGIYYLSVTLDINVGEEVVLIIYDPTDFIHDLRAVVPFRFYMSSMAVNTNFGPVFSFLFWVCQPHDETKSFAIYDKPIDISKPHMLQSWSRLANQSHVHLLLVGENYEVEGFYEFENTYSFGEALETISELDASRVKDFNKAEQEYFNDFSLEYLYELATSRG